MTKNLIIKNDTCNLEIDFLTNKHLKDIDHCMIVSTPRPIKPFQFSPVTQSIAKPSKVIYRKQSLIAEKRSDIKFSTKTGQFK